MLISSLKVCCRRQWQLPSCSQYSEVRPPLNIEMDSTTSLHLNEQLGYSCVPSSLCDQGVIVTDGSGILQVNLTFFKLVGFFKNQMSTSHKFKIAGKKARGDKCTGKEQLSRQRFFLELILITSLSPTLPTFVLSII